MTHPEPDPLTTNNEIRALDLRFLFEQIWLPLLIVQSGWCWRMALVVVGGGAAAVSVERS